MKNKWLKLFSRFIQLSYLLNGFLCIIIGLASIGVLLTPSYVLDVYIDYPHAKFLALGGLLLLFLTLMVYGYLLTYLLNIIDNLEIEKYFVRDNLNNIQRILKGFMMLWVLDVFRVTVLFLAIEVPLSELVSKLLQIVLNNVMYLGFIYLISLVFKRGIAVQDDVNQII